MGKRKGESHYKERKGEVDLFDCKFIGEGHNGAVYRMKDGRVIKIYKNISSGIKEYEILEKVNGNRYFPRVYEGGGNYMIRDYVGGKNLKQYIKENGINKKLSRKIIELLEEFKKLKFTKIDIRCKDIFVQKDGSLKVIDPKSTYKRKKLYPHRLMIGLNNLGALECFKEVLKKEKPKLYKAWITKGRDLEDENGN